MTCSAAAAGFGAAAIYGALANSIAIRRCSRRRDEGCMNDLSGAGGARRHPHGRLGRDLAHGGGGGGGGDGGEEGGERRENHARLRFGGVGRYAPRLAKLLRRSPSTFPLRI
ncbi:uncharacterized protein GLRG_09427 [Colletotrichum graminicola M1.001]|uniref:Uncharacterized protein n=1 Tax=Colletotrichum graminicola (strain M1.001 / M2 / FGSC 10212) TaxID=645133 RepID=E3QTX1_COLGM|nr:uncharacterized protein GLRG_09427 [Colletotrichum graminicola M1.001]EFQ34283.1 hypothetical protein GLRG_09427 [Colletotrichum graminicola M1.001]